MRSFVMAGVCALLISACGGASPDPSLDLRGVYRLVITHESGAPGAERIANKIAQRLSGSEYLKVRVMPVHHPIEPKRQGEASIHISTTIRTEQDDFYSGSRRRGAYCGMGDESCNQRFPDDFYETATLWGTLRLRLFRFGFAPQDRTIVDHISRGPTQDLYDRLAGHVLAML